MRARRSKGLAARDILKGLGFRQTFVLSGGTESWAQANLPFANS